MINNSNINWENKYPFKIFSISNFLNENDYNKINLNFPNFEDINKDNFFKFEDNKFVITSGSPEYQKIILKNETLKNFHDFVNGDQFKKIFFFNLFKHILFSRKYDLKHFFKVLKIPRFVKKIEKNFFLKNFSIFSKYRITIQYSYILNGGKIVPHPDAGDKILTLLLFFPQYQNNEIYKKKELKYGTTFREKNFKNLKDKHLRNLDDQKEFKKKSKILFEAEFTQNKLFGFFKNQHSWHSVEPIDISNEYVRKSININIYY